MADFSKTCQENLQSVKLFMEKAEAHTPEFDQRLKSLDEVVVILSRLIQGAVVDVDQKWLELARNLCKILLFGDWTRLAMTVASQSTFVNEMENKQKADETSKLPSHMQIKVEEIIEYSKKCQDILKGTDKIMHSLIEKVCRAADANFKGNLTEDIPYLQMGIKDLESRLGMSKKYLNSSRVAFDKLRSLMDAEKWNRNVKFAASATGFGATMLIGGVAILQMANQIGAVQKCGALLGRLGTTQLAALSLGGGLAATSRALYIYYYINSHTKMLDDQLSKVESYLQRAETEYDAQEGRFNDMLKGLKR